MGAGLFILSICVIFAGFANHVMKIAFSGTEVEIQKKEIPQMVWPQFALLFTSIVLFFWMPGTLHQTIINALSAIGP